MVRACNKCLSSRTEKVKKYYSSCTHEIDRLTALGSLLFTGHIDGFGGWDGNLIISLISHVG